MQRALPRAFFIGWAPDATDPSSLGQCGAHHRWSCGKRPLGQKKTAKDEKAVADAAVGLDDLVASDKPSDSKAQVLNQFGPASPPRDTKLRTKNTLEGLLQL